MYISSVMETQAVCQFKGSILFKWDDFSLHERTALVA